MYDIFFVSPTKTDDYYKLKTKYPFLKFSTSVEAAQKSALTEFFWVVWNDLNVKEDFDFSYTPDNWSKEYVHVFLNDKDYDGIVLIPKKRYLIKKEIDHRFFVNKKEVPIVASTPKPFDQFEIDSYEEYLQAYDSAQTQMFWMTSKNVKVDQSVIDNFYFSHHNSYDRNENHAFIHKVGDQDLYNGVFLLSKNKKVSERELSHRFIVNRKEWDVIASGPVEYEKFYIDTYEQYLEALEKSKTEMFWVISSSVNVNSEFSFDVYFTHDQKFDRTINHIYKNGKFFDGIMLCSKHSRISKREFDYRFIAHKKEVDTLASTPKPYDIVFISYQEPNADENYKRLLTRYPTAKRVHGVEGIHNAHIEAAKLCNTDMFWIVDGDAVVVNSFEFDYQVAKWDKDTVHVWRSQNPINGLVYGYGGVKLFPTELTLNMDVSKPDMTTSISSKFKPIFGLSNITAFNTDPFNTWKSAFRECCKLSSKVIDRQKDDETLQRLETWCTVGADKPFGEYAIAGAQAGKLYGLENKDNIEALKQINDFAWLQEKFNEQYS